MYHVGQAESGKSTLLKNFQLHFTPRGFEEETDAWRAVIYINLIRSIIFTLDLLCPKPDPNNQQPTPTAEALKPIKMRLSPLKQVEIDIVTRLSGDQSRGVRSVEDIAPWYFGRASEVVIRSGSGWKSMLRRKVRPSSEGYEKIEELDNAMQVLEACREDIISLWANPLVRAGLAEEGVALHEQSGLYVT